MGRSVQEIAEERGSDPESVVLDILLEQEGNVNIVEHCPVDGEPACVADPPSGDCHYRWSLHGGRSHPRLYATFPLLLGDMVRERKWLSLEEAVHKVTAKPAATFHLRDRGQIAEGYVGDVTVFDPQTVRTDASYEMPDVAPTGIRAVLRNGSVVVDSGVAV